ncbi:hypothetical protein ACLBYG_22020 [Methylobacterium sp. D53M]
MQLSLNDSIAAVGAVFAFLALVVSFLAWRFPRRPAATVYPNFQDDVTNGTEPAFIEFLEKNDRKIVRLFVRVPFDAKDIISESHDEEGRVSSTLSLLRNPAEGHGYGGLEVMLASGNEAVGSPVVYANGAHHIDGFFLVVFHPGIFHGFSGVTLTEVAADQVALRS